MLPRPSKRWDTTFMLTCRPSPETSVTATLVASSASSILAFMLSMSSLVI